MTTGTSLRPTALIVHAHPEVASFSTAQAETARLSLAAQGYEATMIDLYARGWNPVLDQCEFAPFEGAFKPQREQWNAVKNGTLSVEVQADLDAVLAADLLVLSFPMWWFSVPSILKGWIDRVFVMGATFGGDLGLFESAGLAGRQAIVLTSTGGSPASFEPGGAFGDVSDFLYHVHRGMLEFVGYTVLEPVITYGPAHLTTPERAEALDSVAEAFASIERRLPLSEGRAVVARH